MSTDWQKVKEIFIKALEVPSEQRHAFVQQSCDSDEAVRQEVEVLLAADPRRADFLEQAKLKPRVDARTTVALQHSPGTRIDRYILIEELARGGIGIVYKAYDSQLDRLVALKLLNTLVHGTADDWFKREAQALAQLSHPNVVSVFDVDTFDGQIFIAMELVEGVTLRDWLADESRTQDEILSVFSFAGKGLLAAHRAGLVHRDFKPANVMVGDDGCIRVLDFGLAKGVRSEESTPALAASSEQKTPEAAFADQRLLSKSLTVPGLIAGTPDFMAPEQRKGESVDSRADQYSFCLSLFEALCRGEGRQGENLKTDKLQYLQDEGRIPHWICQILARGLQSKPEDRYGSMEELLGKLTDDPEKKANERRRKTKRLVTIMVLALVAVAIPIAVWYELAVRRSKLCTGAKEKIATVWNPQVKESISKAFLGTGVSYAKDTVVRVNKLFDSYTIDWAAHYTKACEATHAKGEQSDEVLDLRMGCLRKRMRELGALLKVFAGADAGVVQKAVQASSSLTEINICANEKALRVPYPPPKTKDEEAKVAAIREKLADVVALVKTGKYQEGLDLAKKLEKEANEVEYRPVQAEALYQLGELLERTGDYKKAETTLHNAARAAGESQDALLAAKAMIWLVRVVGYLQARHEEGLLIAQDTEVILGLAREAEAVRATLFNTRGTVFYSKGDYDKALSYFRRALAIREKTLGPEHPLLAESLNNLGVMLQGQGDYDKAMESHRKALAIKEKVLGPEHPDVAVSLNNLGGLFSVQGEYDKALEYYHKALAIREKALGPEHPLLAESLSGIGNMSVDQGQHHDALVWLERVVSLCEKKTCYPDPYGRGLFGLAQVLEAIDGDNQRAIRLATEAREVFGKNPKAFKKELEEINAWLKEHDKGLSSTQR